VVSDETHTASASASCHLSQTKDNIDPSSSEPVDFNLIPLPPPKAFFSASQTSGNAPLTVNFYDNSTNDPQSRRWSFGDGGSSTRRNPSHVYETSGTFTVSLTLSSYCGSDTETKVDYISVSEGVEPTPPPAAAFTAARLSGTAPFTVSFTDLSSGWLTSWLWNFGDGQTSTGQHPSHTYVDAGTYTVSLKTSNENGSDTETKINYINVLAQAPIADFTFSPASGNAPLTAEFADLSTNSPTSWSWDFGDGETSNEQNPAHVYTSAGTYTVTLSVLAALIPRPKQDACRFIFPPDQLL
jgi:PKD repeat protein